MLPPPSLVSQDELDAAKKQYKVDNPNEAKDPYDFDGNEEDWVSPWGYLILFFTLQGFGARGFQLEPKPRSLPPATSDL